MSSRENHKKLGQIIAQCWSDADFKKRFIANPKQILTEQGIHVPEDVEIKVVENTEREYFITIPERSTELSDAALDAVAGGVVAAKKQPSWG